MGHISTQLRRNILLPAAWIALAAYILARQLLPSLGQVTHGYVGHYTAARLLSDAALGPQVYNDDWFAGQVQRYTGPAVYEIFTPNLPTVSLLALPLSQLPAQHSRDLWIILSGLALLATCGLLTAIGSGLGQSWERSGWILLPGLIALLPAIGANLRVGQTYLFLNLLLTLALLGLVSRRDGLLGGPLGLAFALKTSGLFLWFVLLMERRWRALGWGIALILAIALISLPWIGLDNWLAYPSAVHAFSRRAALAVPAYQTTAGLFTHLFVFDAVWNPTPLSHLPLMATLLPIGVTVVTIAVTLWLGRRSDPPLLFAALLPTTIILLPVAEEYHFVLLLSSIFIILSYRLGQPLPLARLKPVWLGLGLAFILLIAPVPFKTADWAIGWWALLAYPRLYGAWLLWGVAVYLMARVGRTTW